MSPRTIHPRRSGARRLALAAAASLLLAAGAAGPAGAEERVKAITGATLHPISGPAIENGVLLVSGGKIQAIGGSDLAVPADAEVIALPGRHVYPGFVYLASQLGLIEIGSVAGTRDTQELPGNNAHHRAEVAVNADSLRLLPAIAGGVLTAHVIPGGGSFRGTSAVVSLAGWNWEEMTLRTPVGMHLSFPDVLGGGEDGGTEDNEVQELTDLLDQARHYDRAQTAVAEGKARRVDHDARLAALVPVARGELPLYLHANEAEQIGAALDWAAEQGLENLVLVADHRAAELAERLAEEEIPLILQGIYDLPRRDEEGYDAPFTAPRRLLDAGVRFVISDGGGSFGNANARSLPFEAAAAVPFGLDPEVALRKITLEAAELVGVGDRLGSLDAGKDATFFVSTGSPLEIRSLIERAWIAGDEIDLSQDHQARLYEKYRNRPLPVGR